MENRAYFEIGFQDTERGFYLANGIFIRAIVVLRTSELRLDFLLFGFPWSLKNFVSGNFRYILMFAKDNFC